MKAHEEQVKLLAPGKQTKTYIELSTIITEWGFPLSTVDELQERDRLLRDTREDQENLRNYYAYLVDNSSLKKSVRAAIEAAATNSLQRVISVNGSTKSKLIEKNPVVMLIRGKYMFLCLLQPCCLYLCHVTLNLDFFT